MYYVFPPPVSPRVFTVLITTHLESDSSPRTGLVFLTRVLKMTKTNSQIRLIISNTVDLSGDQDLAKLEEKGVKGRYMSIERITELENGKVEWRMAVSSSPGGMIPAVVSEGSMAGQISKARSLL